MTQVFFYFLFPQTYMAQSNMPQKWYWTERHIFRPISHSVTMSLQDYCLSIQTETNITLFYSWSIESWRRIDLIHISFNTPSHTFPSHSKLDYLETVRNTPHIQFNLCCQPLLISSFTQPFFGKTVASNLKKVKPRIQSKAFESLHFIRKCR